MRCREQLEQSGGQDGQIHQEDDGKDRKSNSSLTQERKESDKKIQSSLETYLIELTSFKGKANSSCSASIRELKELEKDVEHL